jgi:hypothetical protein
VLNSISAWESFYVIVGSSAAALTGLQFVVIALVADQPGRRSASTIDAFGTPTIVHFGTVLLVSAILSAPWRGSGAPTILCSVCGALGVAYAIIVARRARGQSDYQPVFEDWLFHVLLPAASYGLLTATAFVARWHVEVSLFGVATAVLALLFIGIHNAWDTVTYLVITRDQQQS